jgi:hypothetical protein
MTKVFDFKFSKKVDPGKVHDLFFFSSIAAKAVLGVGQNELEMRTLRDDECLPVGILLGDEIAETLSKIFTGFCETILMPGDFKIVYPKKDKGGCK